MEIVLQETRPGKILNKIFESLKKFMFSVIFVQSNSLQIDHLCMMYDGTTILDQDSSDHSLPPNTVLPPSFWINESCSDRESYILGH